jgi:hypothetical protein
MESLVLDGLHSSPVRLGSRPVQLWTLNRQLVCTAIVVLGGMR